MRYHHSPLSCFNSYFLPERSVHIIAMIASVHNRRLRLASLASVYPSALPPLLQLPPAPGREGSRSAHSPRRVALASASNFPRLSSLEYCRYHHARPAAPSSRFRTRLSGRITSATVRPYPSRSVTWTVTVFPNTISDVNCLKPDLLGPPIMQHLDRIAVRDTNHAAGEVGEGRGDEQKNDDEDEKEYPLHFLGFHSRARRCASSICADDILGASRSRASAACLTPCAAARLNHMCACT